MELATSVGKNSFETIKAKIANLHQAKGKTIQKTHIMQTNLLLKANNILNLMEQNSNQNSACPIYSNSKARKLIKIRINEYKIN